MRRVVVAPGVYTARPVRLAMIALVIGAAALTAPAATAGASAPSGTAGPVITGGSYNAADEALTVTLTLPPGGGVDLLSLCSAPWAGSGSAGQCRAQEEYEPIGSHYVTSYTMSVEPSPSGTWYAVVHGFCTTCDATYSNVFPIRAVGAPTTTTPPATTPPPTTPPPTSVSPPTTTPPVPATTAPPPTVPATAAPTTTSAASDSATEPPLVGDAACERVADLVGVEAEQQGALTAAQRQLAKLKAELAAIQADTTLTADQRATKAALYTDTKIPTQERNIDRWKSAIARQQNDIGTARAGCNGGKVEQPKDLTGTTNVSGGTIQVQPGTNAFGFLPDFVDVQSGSIHWVENPKTFQCRFGSTSPAPGTASGWVGARCATVVTPHAAAVLTGTDVAVTVTDEATVIDVRAGTVVVADAGGTSMVTVKAGQVTTVLAGNAPSTPVDAGHLATWWSQGTASRSLLATWWFDVVLAALALAAVAAVAWRLRGHHGHHAGAPA